MAMGEQGMHKMGQMHMRGPKNTLGMMGGEGSFDTVAMGGMFTILKVRDNLQNYDQDPGWYKNLKGTVASRVELDK
tara:strand:+ start:586 stop:813 length:228 start_codon:yes stop_codon:yes gene_type:complete